jgi:hypothetical protein
MVIVGSKAQDFSYCVILPELCFSLALICNSTNQGIEPSSYVSYDEYSMSGTFN